MAQFLSGMQANIGAYNAILAPGDTVISAPARHGGHYSHNQDGPLRFFPPRILPVPFDERTYNIDLDALAELCERERPKLLIVGWSEFLFPHPLEKIRAICDRHSIFLMYDMSHVAGLIAGGMFQPEAGRLADVVTWTIRGWCATSGCGLSLSRSPGWRSPSTRPFPWSNPGRTNPTADFRAAK